MVEDRQEMQVHIDLQGDVFDQLGDMIITTEWVLPPGVTGLVCEGTPVDIAVPIVIRVSAFATNGGPTEP